MMSVVGRRAKRMSRTCGSGRRTAWASAVAAGGCVFVINPPGCYVVLAPGRVGAGVPGGGGRQLPSAQDGELCGGLRADERGRRTPDATWPV